MFETLPENPGIRHFTWDHFKNVNWILQQVQHARGTFSAANSHICVPSAIVVGHLCTYEGCLPDTAHVQKIVDWPICQSLTEVWGFLGTIGTIQIFIKDYATIAHLLVRLTQKNVEFTFEKQELEAMKKLKVLAKNSPAIRAINYASRNRVILAVDTSSIAVGYILSQMGADAKGYPCHKPPLWLSPFLLFFSLLFYFLFIAWESLSHYVTQGVTMSHQKKRSRSRSQVTRSHGGVGK